MRTYSTENVWNFPRQVAANRGTFDERGVSVEFVERPERETEFDDVYTRSNVRLFASGDIDLYSACNWGVLKRVREQQIGEIGLSRPAADNVPYGIYVAPDTEFNRLSDLASAPVGIKRHSGSHYAAALMLERELPWSAVRLKHAGRPMRRLARLTDGTLAAATLTGPTVAVAEHLGYERVAELHTGGAFVVRSSVEPQTLTRVRDGLNDAVKEINQNPEKYRNKLREMVARDLAATADDIGSVDIDAVTEQINVPSYSDRFERPSVEKFQELLDWMENRGLAEPGPDAEELVRTR